MSKKLFMLMLGCTPPGRHTEQHDIFFGIADTLKDLIPDIKAFWREANGRIHIDAWREVTQVEGHKIEVTERVINDTTSDKTAENGKLFFINLGGYLPGVFDEPHKKLITVQPSASKAIAWAKNTYFFRDVQFEGANSHIDDKFGVDVDDIYNIEDILPAYQKEKYQLKISTTQNIVKDELHLGYFKLNNLP